MGRICINRFCCPKCGWDPCDITDRDSPELFYYIENGKAKGIWNGWIQDPNNERAYIPNEQVLAIIANVKKVKIYPVRYDGEHYRDMSIGATGYYWMELHKCPNCNIEFTFENSSF